MSLPAAEGCVIRGATAAQGLLELEATEIGPKRDRPALGFLGGDLRGYHERELDG